MLLTVNKNGIYCEKADLYIDPWRPVKRALITHGHGDHARWGSETYLSTEQAAPVIRYRLSGAKVDTVRYGEEILHKGVKISFHPAGHIPGSAQIRLEGEGEIWVVTGDYKLARDNISEPFDLVKCTHLVTECTFGLPVYKWDPEEIEMEKLQNWWSRNASENKASMVGAYALGKAQRILAGLKEPLPGPVFTHGAVENINQVLRRQGYDLIETTRVTPDIPKENYRNALIIAPPSALGSNWIKKFGDSEASFASGWMKLRGIRRRRGFPMGFVISDHVDWNGLMNVVEDSGAEYIFPTHGYTETVAKYLRERGYISEALETAFGDEEE